MSWEAVVFWMMATVTVGSGLCIIFERNIVRMAFWLLATLLGVSGFYLLMGADFLGLTQVFVYIGGINVLLLFGIMLTNQDPIYLRHALKKPRRGPALLLGLLVFCALATAITQTAWRVAAEEVQPTAKSIGTFLLSDYVLPFEIISILLLVVLVGAAYIARREPEGSTDG